MTEKAAKKASPKGRVSRGAATKRKAARGKGFRKSLSRKKAFPEEDSQGKTPEGKATCNIFVMGKRYPVPQGLTIMAAIERVGYQFIRGCGCRAGFCGACSTVYRKGNEQKLHFALACQTQVEDDMYLVQIPFVPALKAKYELEKLKPEENVILSLYPEIARCVACNTCTKSCPQEIEVMQYIQRVLRGDIAKAAEISFDCIQCGMCAMRCPADIKHYHAGQLARRLRGKYLDKRSSELKIRIQELDQGKHDGEIRKLKSMNREKLEELYRNRKLEV